MAKELNSEYMASINFDYKFVSSISDLNNITNLAAGEKAIFSTKLNNGEIGIFALIENDFIAYAWSKQPGVYYQNDNPLISLSESEAYLYYCHTVENFRGYGIYPRLLILLSEKMFKSGVKVIYVDTSPINIASQRGIGKVGFKKMHTIRILRLFGITVKKNIFT